MDKVGFLTELRAARARWDALLAEVGETRMIQPGAAGEWSVKDIIAHITWGEREMIGVLNARALVGSPLWQRPRDVRNAAVFEANRARPLAGVLADARQTFLELLAAINSVPAEDLQDAARFANWPPAWIPDWPPLRLVASNSLGHYDEHLPDLRGWLERAKTVE